MLEEWNELVQNRMQHGQKLFQTIFCISTIPGGHAAFEPPWVKRNETKHVLSR